VTVAEAMRAEALAFSGRNSGLEARIFEPKSALQVKLPVVLQLFRPGPSGREESHGYTYDVLMVSGGDPYPATVYHVYEGAPQAPVTVYNPESVRAEVRAALESSEMRQAMRKISSEIP